MRVGHNLLGITRTQRVHSITGMSTKGMAIECIIHQSIYNAREIQFDNEEWNGKVLQLKMQGINTKEKTMMVICNGPLA